MNYFNVAKGITESFKIIRTIKEHVSGVDTTITEIKETVKEGKKVVSSVQRIITNKKVQNEEPYSIIPKPTTNNKAEIYNWIYNESKNIHGLLFDNLWELTRSTAKHPNIRFWVEGNKDKLFFSVDDLSDWKRFKDCLLFETFSLKPRLEKLQEYTFDEEDMKRINDSIELVNRFNEPKSNLEMAHSFYETDKMLAAYYYREFLNIFLFEFLRTKTIDEMTSEEREARIEELEEILKKAMKSIKK